MIPGTELRRTPSAFALAFLPSLVSAHAHQDAENLFFKVIDPENRPVAGAVAFRDLLGIGASDPTNTQGSGVLEVRKGQSEFFIFAPHFRLAKVDVTRGGPAPVLVHLKKSNALELMVRLSDGSASRDAVAVLQTEGIRIFPYDNSSPAEILRQNYFITARSCGGGGGSHAEGQPVQFGLALGVADEGRILLEDVIPHLSISIDVVDEISTPLVPTFKVELGEDEHASLEKRIDWRLQDFVIQVRDGHRSGVPAARVKVISALRPHGGTFEHGIPITRKTDATGACRLSGIRSTQAVITVEKNGFRSWYRSDVEIGPEHPSIECVLAPSASD